MKDNPYLRLIYQAHVDELPQIGIMVDVYSVLDAFDVRCHAVGHAIKKLLAAGKRGDKSYEQDLQEAVASIKRAIEINKGHENQDSP